MSQSASGSIRVLHVDDEPDFVELVTTHLRRENERISVDAATDASEGLARLARDDFDCIISDYEMPGMDGLEFLTAVRETKPDMPFILFTGKGSEEVASDAITAGVTDYLQKHQGTEQYELLANRIHNAVGQYRAERRANEQERVLTLLQNVNQTLVQSSTRDEIETGVTDILASADPYRIAWIGEHDAEWNRIVPRTVAGIDGDAVTPTSIPEDPANEGAVLRALRERNLVVTNHRDQTLDVWADEAPPPQYDVSVVVPIIYQGDPYGVLALYGETAEVVDTTERELLLEIAGDTAQALHADETRRRLNRHRTAVEAVPEGVFVLDEDANVVLINESAAALADRRPEEITGGPFLAFVEEGIFDEAIVDWYLTSVREMLSSTTDRTEAWYETEISLPSGGLRTVEIHITLRPYDEAYRGTVGIIRDVTGRKRRERELAENEERYRQLVENAPVPIALYDERGELIFVNDAAVTFIGAEDEGALLGRSTVEFVHPDDRKVATTRLQRILGDREPTPATELSLVDQTGARKEVVLSGVPVTYENRPAGQVVIRDITEQKRRERELERQRDRLDEFASVVSHDLRNPLNVSKGWLQLARAECDSEHLDRVAQAQNRMGTLIDDLLTFARVGDSAVDETDVALAALAERCWRNVETHEARLITETTRSVRAAPSLVQQLLENLIRNAVEHGGPDVTITVGDLDGGSGFYVADDGVGIPEGQRDQIFESGYSTGEEGTGLGLAIVREISDAHGWTIDVTERDGGGTQFAFSEVEAIDQCP